MYNGNGVYLFPDGKKYHGEFKNNKFNGVGTFTFPNGKMYTGGFKNNQFHGQGTYVFPNGKKFTGRFKKNRYVGDGEYDGDFEGEIIGGDDISIVDGVQTEDDFEAAMIDQEYQTKEEREALELEAIKAYEKGLSIVELERLVKQIPGSRTADNLRIYEELLRRQPENKKYQKKVAYYKKRFEKQKKRTGKK